MARGPMAAAMVGKTIGRRIEEDQIPVYVERFGSRVEEIFVTATELKHQFKERFNDLPTGAIGLHGYFMRLSQGLKQLMAGNRKFALSYISRDDIAALTKEAADISGQVFYIRARQEIHIFKEESKNSIVKDGFFTIDELVEMVPKVLLHGIESRLLVSS